MEPIETEIERTIGEFIFRSNTAPAGACVRFCAFLLDLIPVLLLGRILHAVVGALAGLAGVLPSAWEDGLLRVAAFAVAFWGWEAVWCSSRFQATPGKMAHGLRVVTRDKGIRIEFPRASRRAFFKMVPVVWIAVRAAVLLFGLHLLGASTSFSPGPASVRWLYPAMVALLALAPAIPSSATTAWNYSRQCEHDSLAGTLVRAPVRMPVRSIVLQIAEYAAAALLCMYAVHGFVRNPSLPSTFRLRREAEEIVAEQFSERFAKAPFRVEGVRLGVPDGAFGGSLGAIFAATNFEGTLRLSRRSGSIDLPILASEGNDGLESRLDEEAGALRLLDGFLVERAMQKPADVVASKPDRPAGKSAKPRAIGPEEEVLTKDGLSVRFFGAETVPWPDDEPAKSFPWIVIADFRVRNDSSQPRFLADWDATCKADGKPAAILWLGSFDPLHANLAPGASCEGTLLFGVAKQPSSVKIGWLGLEFDPAAAPPEP